MSDVPSLLLEDARTTLLRLVASVAGKGDTEESFVTWLVGNSLPSLGIEAAASAATTATGASRSASAVATLGYAAGIRQLSDDEDRALKSGLSWIANCDPVVRGTPMPFCMDAVTLAGVILGARRCDSCELKTKVGEWLSRCRNATVGGQGLGEWQEWLLAIVAEAVGLDWSMKAAEGLDAAETRIALRSKGLELAASSGLAASDEVAVLSRILTQDSSECSTVRAALRLASIEWIRRQRPVADLRAVSLGDVGSLLRHIPFGLKKWTWEAKPRTKSATEARRWHVDNEYHVQNMIWLVLAPLFPDLIDEDSTPKVGPVQPRADIGIPSLRLVVEAKFMRATNSPKDMIEQIAEDASLYRVAGSKYDTLIPFIWDDSRRSEHHEEMIRGLRQIPGIADAIIVSRPGAMMT